MKSIFIVAGLLVLSSACTLTDPLSGAIAKSQQSTTPAIQQLALATVSGSGETTLNTSQLAAVLAQTTVSSLSTAERDGLIFMREEEKLAFDVYTALGQKWSDQRFQNIPRSEASHTESVRVLLEKYGLDDPNATHTAGIYQNADLQQAYDALLAKGQVSLVDALKVGAEVEELDIADLQRLLNDVLSEDIRLVYNELLRGSRNHLRAFVKGLSQNGATYTAVHMTQAEFDTIAQGEIERGATASRGSGQGRNRGQGR